MPQSLLIIRRPPLTSYQGLTFLHEHSIVHLNCSKHTSFKVDLSAGSSSTEFPASTGSSITHSRRSHLTNRSTSHSHSTHSSACASPFPANPSPLPEPTMDALFDRTKFPVKYYLVDFSNAIQLAYPAPSTSSDRDRNRSSSTLSSPYLKDVQDLGILFNDMIDNVNASSSLNIAHGNEQFLDPTTHNQVQISRVGYDHGRIYSRRHSEVIRSLVPFPRGIGV
jgi:hypothetical protein